MTKKKTLVLDALILLVGCALYAVSVQMFTTPNKIAVGGLTGLASALHYLLNFSVGTTVFVMNIPLFLLSYKKLGKRFFIKTAIAMVCMSVFLNFAAHLPTFTDDKLLAAIAGGAGTGIGLGMIYGRGMATGGSDLLARLIEPFMGGMSYGKVILLIDALILIAAGLIYTDLWSILYSAITVWLCSAVVDAIQNGIDRAKQVQIITAHPDEILQTVLHDMQRGATLLRAEGGFTQQEKAILLIVVRSYELFRLKERVRNVDPNAFLIISDATEVMGEGFRKSSE